MAFCGTNWLNWRQNATILDFLEQVMMEVEVTTEAVRRRKLHSNCHRQQTNNRLVPFLLPSNGVKALKEESITFHGLAHPKLTYILKTTAEKKTTG